MHKLLRGIHRTKNTLVLLLMFIGMAPLCFGQITLTDTSPKDIRFTLNQNQPGTGQSYSTISYTDFIRNSIGREQFDIQEFSAPNLGNNSFYYISDDNQYISAGRVQSTDSEEANFIKLTLKNESPHNFGGIMLAFDFVYNFSQIQQEYHLTLQYRSGDSQWRSVNGSTISTASFNDGGDEWDTFSVQLKLDQIYLRNGDELGLRWVFNNRNPDEVEPHLPIGLQRIEVIPDRAEDLVVDQGSLIITEIMPKTITEDLEFEYIELFNTSEFSIPLKGLELRSSIGTAVVQQNIDLPPYSSVILSNLDMSGVESVEVSYIYNDFILPASGRVEVSRNGQLIARVIYESQEEGQALELDRMIHAINGYTSLQNLNPSDHTFVADIRGTPGSTGQTVPFYTRTISTEGWYLISLPGFLPERLNRHETLEYFEPSGARLSIQQIEPYSTILVHKTGNQPVKLYSEQTPLSVADQALMIWESGNGFRIAASSDPRPTHLWSVRREGDRPLSPIVQVWDERQQKFTLQFSDQYAAENWSTFILNADIGGELEYSSTGYSASAPVTLEGTLPVRLYEGSGSSRALRDEAIIGFTDIPVQYRNERFDLPKLAGSFQGENRLPDRNKLYLTNPESRYRTNSFTHLPYNIDGSKRVGVGFEPEAGASGIATIEWNLANNIPDEWTLRLEDTETGITVDMREVDNYRFRYTGEPVTTDARSRFSGLSVYNPGNRNRFVMVIDPFEPLAEVEQENVRTGSIELRQNYPNPFNPTTNITFYLPEERSVRIGVYNIVGQQVSMLVDETLQAGEHSVVWDGTNSPSGIYIVQMETGNRILTRKITLIK